MKALALLLIPPYIFLCTAVVFVPLDWGRKKFRAEPWWLVPLAISIIFPTIAVCIVGVATIIRWVAA